MISFKELQAELKNTECKKPSWDNYAEGFSQDDILNSIRNRAYYLIAIGKERK